MSKLGEPFPVFHDDDGTPLDDGMIYVGAVNQDARQNPIQVYWDAARTQPATQPIRTLGGRPSYQGAPAAIYMAETSFSVTVLNRFGTPILSAINTSPFVTAGDIADVSASQGRTSTATTATFTAADQNSVLVCTNASAITLTVPNDTTLNLPVWSFVEVHQGGAGAVTFTAGSGVSLLVRGSFTKTNGQNAVIGFRKVAANTWRVMGDMAA